MHGGRVPALESVSRGERAMLHARWCATSAEKDAPEDPARPPPATSPHATRIETRCIVLLRYPLGFQSMAWGCITPALSVARAQTS